MDDQTLDVEEREPEILEAYGSLSTPTSPPDDLLVRVERGIRRRRTARRSVVGAAAIVIVGTVGVQVLGGGDGSDGTTATDQPGSDTSTLTFTRTDGSTYTFDAADLELTCPKPGPDDRGRQHLVLSRGDDAQPVLYVDLIVDKIEPGRVFDLPHEGSGDSSTWPMIFFFTAGQGDDANELSSAQPGASGTVTVHEASCGPTPSLWLDIAGTLGSEVEQPALAIEGSYRS